MHNTKIKKKRIIIGWNLKRYDGVVWSGLIWLRIATSGDVL
jgi:hypothetical protein